MRLNHCGEPIQPVERRIRPTLAEREQGITAVLVLDGICRQSGCKRRLLYTAVVRHENKGEWQRVREKDRPSVIKRLRLAKAYDSVLSQRQWDGKVLGGMVWRPVE